MNFCYSYKIYCLYKLSDEAPVPCIGSNEECKKWRDKPRELPSI